MYDDQKNVCTVLSFSLFTNEIKWYNYYHKFTYNIDILWVELKL